MEELKCTPEELKDIIDDSKLIGRGFFGKVFTYKDKLIKLDSSLYDLLNANDKNFSDELFAYRYRFDKSDFADKEQIERLASKQSNITLTKLPLGVVNVKGQTPGIIIPYHRDHDNLARLPKDDYKRLLIVLRKLLLSVQELADNQIYQKDLHLCYNHNKKYNVLYKNDTPQIIDLDGDYVTCGESFEDSKKMFNDLGEIIFDVFDYNKMKHATDRGNTPTYQEIKNLINEFERETKGIK